MDTDHYIDINCDMGESYGSVIVGSDAEIFPFITSCNIACGFHGGDPVHMEKTVLAALEHGVQIGAHPSYPDREHFGRKKMQIPARELRAILQYQLGALLGVTKALGGRVAYVKPHGALYNTAAENANESRVIIDATRSIDEDLALMGLAGSEMEEVARQHGMVFITEAFADRRYLQNGRLVSRHAEGAVIDNPEQAATQVLSIVLQQQVQSIEGNMIAVNAKSICVHGDHPNTVAVLRAIDEALELSGIEKRAVTP